MKTFIHTFALVSVLTFMSAAAAQQATTPREQIHATAEMFIKTFDNGDAEGIAEFWTKDGDYVDEAGQKFVGRAAIENAYEAFFAANAGAKITLAVDNIRLLNDDIAIEDGRATVSLPKGPPTQSRYTVVHVKLDGEWQMSSVRETSIVVPTNHARLADLDFLVGSWQSENHGATLQLECKWIANHNFLERTYTVTENNHPLTSTKEIIGWDPSAKVIKSWTFSSTGGNSVGVWAPHDKGWMIDSSGVLQDGTPTSAVYVLSYVDDNAIAWKSVRRSRGNTQLPETDEIIIKRKAAEKK